MDETQPLPEGKGALKEISRAQRWTHRSGMVSLSSARVRQDKPVRNEASYGYTMAAAAREAAIRCSTVSKIIEGGR